MGKLDINLAEVCTLRNIKKHLLSVCDDLNSIINDALMAMINVERIWLIALGNNIVIYRDVFK